jgi:lysophosphatidic acid acyltransferase/lysophosphatidylinositol acyltransferase
MVICMVNDQLHFRNIQVVITWIFVVVAGTVKLLQWSSLLSSWKGIAFSIFSLAIVTALMQILIMFSQSERSNPAKVSPSKPKHREELQGSDDKQE